VTPLDGAFTTEVASKHLAGMLDEKGVNLVTEFNTGEVDGVGGRLIAYDGREVRFDLAVVIPVHSGAPCIQRSPGLGDALGFVATDDHTLQTKVAPNIFAIGDATSLPISKAGSVNCLEHGVAVAQVPWARHGAGHTRDFDDQVAWLVTHLQVGRGRTNAGLLANRGIDHHPGGRRWSSRQGPL
jgi:sulfide:quinone oxidoreductase